MTPRVFCIAAAFGELGKGGWQFAGPWVADRPEIASAQAVATYMQQNPAVAQLPLAAITVSEVPVDAIRAWLDGIDRAAEAEKKAQAEKVVKWPLVSAQEPMPAPTFRPTYTGADGKCCGLWQAHGGPGCINCPFPPAEPAA